MLGFILGCLTRMPNLQWVYHFQEDLGLIHSRNGISWSGCLCSGRALPAFGGCASLGTANLFQKWVLSYLSGVAPYPLWSFIFEMVWTLSLKKSKHDLWISRLEAFSTPTCLLLPLQTPWKVKDFQLIYFKTFYLSR